MPKRDRDTEEDQSSMDVDVKKEDQETGSQGGHHHSDDMDLEHMKEMVKEGLEREARLSSEKAQLEKENGDLKEEATLQLVHRLFDMNSKPGAMSNASFLPNPNLLNIVKSRTNLDWARAPPSTVTRYHRGTVWYYVSANSWSEVLDYFENGIGDSTWHWNPSGEALASLAVIKEAAPGDRSSCMVVGALTYRCSERFHHHLYKEKYKAEAETLWGEKLGRCSEYMALDGGIKVPTSLHKAIASLRFDSVLEDVFLPTDTSATTGAQYSIDLDKMEAVDVKSKKIVKVFESTGVWHLYKKALQ